MGSPVEEEEIQQQEEQAHHKYIHPELNDRHGAHFDGLLLQDILPPRKHWWHYRYFWHLNIALIAGLMSQATGGYDGSLLNGLQSLPLWAGYFNHPHGAGLGVLNSGISIGQTVAVIIAGPCCDYFGRRIPLGVGCLIVIVGAIVGAASHNFGTFLGGRILVGFGDGLCQVASPMLLAELGHPSQRARLMSMYAPSYPLGGIIAAWTTYATFTYHTTWGWRLPILLQAVFALLQFCCLMISPESPRWLVAKNREKEAMDVIVKYHGAGDPDSPLAKFEMGEIQAAIEVDSIAKQFSWMEFFKTKGTRRRFYLMCVIPIMRQLTGSNIISYYLPLILKATGITNSKTQLELNGCINILAFVCAISTNFFVDRVGRRKIFLFPMALCTLSLVIWTILSAIIYESGYTRPSLGYGVVVMVFVFQGSIHIFDAVMEPYVQEILTYNLRSKGTVMYQFGQQAVGFFSSYVNPVALAAINWKYYILYICINSVWLFVIFFFFPETRGLSLEEVSLVFDGEQALDKQVAIETEFEQGKTGVLVEHREIVV